jgi:hypothetical protein
MKENDVVRIRRRINDRYLMKRKGMTVIFTQTNAMKTIDY